MSASPAEESNLLWFGSVEKVGTNLASHPRVLFVTPQTLLVSLPTGGVTRVISVANITAMVISAASSPVCRVTVRAEQDLVVVLSSVQDARDLVAAIEGARSMLASVAPIAPVSIEWESSLEADKPPTGIRIGRSAASESSFSLAAGSATPSGKRVSFISDNIAEERAASSNSPPQPSSNGSILTSADHGTLRPPSEASARPVPVFGSDGSISLSQVANAASSPLPPYGKISFHSLVNEAATPYMQREQDAMPPPPSALKSLQLQLDATQRVVEDLRRAQIEDAKIRTELEEAKKLIGDLQAALRSQDGAFKEMLRAQDELRQQDSSKAALAQRVAALEEANSKLKRDIDARDLQLEQQGRSILVADEAHQKEIKTIRETFTEYDGQVTAFVQRIREECDAKVTASQQQNAELLVEQGRLRTKLELMDASVRQAVQANADWMPSAISSGTGEPYFSSRTRQGTAPAAASGEQYSESSDLRAALIASLHKYADKKFGDEQLQRAKHKKRPQAAPTTLSPRRQALDNNSGGLGGTYHQYNTPPAQWAAQFRDRSLL